MARWGNCDYKQLQKLRDNLAKLQSMDMDKFCTDVSKELAARLLALVIPRTPVGDYKTEITVTAQRDGKKHKKGETYTRRVNLSGKMGGTLRRGWTARTEAEATSGKGRTITAEQIKAYAQSLPVAKAGSNYTITVINPVQYASYVEFGHRQEVGRYVPAIGKTLKQGWIAGQYFLTLSESDLENLAPAIIERKLEALLKEVFSV